MNFLTYEELKNLQVIVKFFKDLADSEKFFLGADVKLYDQNGEVVGHVQVTDGGEYGFVPIQDDE